MIASASGDVESGKTDPRGLFATQVAPGPVTAIAMGEGGHYAFEGFDRPLMADGPAPREAAPDRNAPAYFKNVLEDNRTRSLGRQQAFDSDVKRLRKGVQVQSVK